MTSLAQSLTTIEIAGGELRRTCVVVDDRPVVVFHKTHPIMKPRFASAEAWQQFLDGSHGAPVFEVDAEDWQWCQASRYAFNCHTLAIGSYVGLGPQDWIEGSPSDFTLGENPARVLLNEFFEELFSWDGIEPLDTNTLPEGSTIVLENAATGDVIHSGTVRKIEGETMILSKLGEHPLVISTLQVLLNEYVGQFSRMSVYRLREQ